MTVRLGITGGIGSGKSVVCELLRLLDIPVYTADAEAKRLMNEDAAIRRQLTALLGEEAYMGDRLNRKAVADFLFKNEANASKINAIVHPAVKRDFERWCAEHVAAPLLGMEAAILFESGFDRLADVSVMVYAPEKVRLKRAMCRDRADEAMILRRIAAQMSDEKKRELCDKCIINDGEQPLIPQVLALISSVLQNNNYLCMLKK